LWQLTLYAWECRKSARSILAAVPAIVLLALRFRLIGHLAQHHSLEFYFAPSPPRAILPAADHVIAWVSVVCPAGFPEMDPSRHFLIHPLANVKFETLANLNQFNAEALA